MRQNTWKDRVNTVAITLAALVRQQGDRIPVSLIAERSNVSSSTVRRVLKHLEQGGALVRNGTQGRSMSIVKIWDPATFKWVSPTSPDPPSTSPPRQTSPQLRHQDPATSPHSPAPEGGNGEVDEGGEQGPQHDDRLWNEPRQTSPSTSPPTGEVAKWDDEDGETPDAFKNLSQEDTGRWYGLAEQTFLESPEMFAEQTLETFEVEVQMEFPEHGKAWRSAIAEKRWQDHAQRCAELRMMLRKMRAHGRQDPGYADYWRGILRGLSRDQQHVLLRLCRRGISAETAKRVIAQSGSWSSTRAQDCAIALSRAFDACGPHAPRERLEAAFLHALENPTPTDNPELPAAPVTPPGSKRLEDRASQPAPPATTPADLSHLVGQPVQYPDNGEVPF